MRADDLANGLLMLSLLAPPTNGAVMRSVLGSDPATSRNVVMTSSVMLSCRNAY
jgi:hypothetical protein